MCYKNKCNKTDRKVNERYPSPLISVAIVTPVSPFYNY